MDERTQEQFDRITSKSVSELTPNDIRFIKARRTYLSKEQKVTFKTILRKVTPEDEKVVDDTYISTKDLKKAAKKLGLQEKGLPREEIEVSIETALGPNYKEELAKLV